MDSECCPSNARDILTKIVTTLMTTVPFQGMGRQNQSFGCATLEEQDLVAMVAMVAIIEE